MAEKEKRNFALRDKDGNEIGVFTGKAPRQAALKAANRGYTDIRLRERGTKKVHIFTGERKQVKKPKSAPKWDLEAHCQEGGRGDARRALKRPTDITICWVAPSGISSDFSETNGREAFSVSIWAII
jgi:hypothetical protein